MYVHDPYSISLDIWDVFLFSYIQIKSDFILQPSSQRILHLTCQILEHFTNTFILIDWKL